MSTLLMPDVPRTESAPSEAALANLVLAFAADPLVRWLLPDGESFLSTFPAFLRLFASGGPGHVRVDSTAGGTGLWLLPGAEMPADEGGLLLAGAIDPTRHDDVFELLGQIDAHHPTEPHHYLPFLGVDPAAQGRGFGSALLRTGLDRADRDGLPSYLEATSPRNRALYERHGFKVVGKITSADSPALWPMIRNAR